MSWKEYLKKYNNEVLGHIVYICDIRVAAGGNKFIRNVPPTAVLIESNENLPKGKNIYYSSYHFLKIKNGKPTKQIIAPYDNTGYRSFEGTSVNLFDKYEECVAYFNNQLKEATKEYDLKIQEIEEQKNKLLDMQVKLEVN